MIVRTKPVTKERDKRTTNITLICLQIKTIENNEEWSGKNEKILKNIEVWAIPWTNLKA